MAGKAVRQKTQTKNPKNNGTMELVSNIWGFFCQNHLKLMLYVLSAAVVFLLLVIFSLLRRIYDLLELQIKLGAFSVKVTEKENKKIKWLRARLEKANRELQASEKAHKKATLQILLLLLFVHLSGILRRNKNK